VFLIYLHLPHINVVGMPAYHPALLRHLLVKKNADVVSGKASVEQSIRAVCAKALSLDLEDIRENVPLSSYGLDSLTSVRLSSILKHYFNITVTQLQLLSNHMTGKHLCLRKCIMNDVGISVQKLQAMQEERCASEAQAATSFESRNDLTGQAAPENDMDKTVVHLNGVTEGRPLFILHGAGGGVFVMQKLAQKINHPVYGVQDTPEAPLTSTIGHLSRFYLSKIKEKQPTGPYLIGGFSFGEWISFENPGRPLTSWCYLQEPLLLSTLLRSCRVKVQRLKRSSCWMELRLCFIDRCSANTLRGGSRRALIEMTCVNLS
jgi:fatty acid synthase, animal type